MTLSFFFTIVALICLLLAAWPPANSRINLFPMGMFFWLLALLSGGLAHFK